MIRERRDKEGLLKVNSVLGPGSAGDPAHRSDQDAKDDVLPGQSEPKELGNAHDVKYRSFSEIELTINGWNLPTFDRAIHRSIRSGKRVRPGFSPSWVPGLVVRGSRDS